MSNPIDRLCPACLGTGITSDSATKILSDFARDRLRLEFVLANSGGGYEGDGFCSRQEVDEAMNSDPHLYPWKHPGDER